MMDECRKAHGNSDYENLYVFSRMLLPLLDHEREREGIDLSALNLIHLACCWFGGHRDKVFQPYRRFPCSDECSAESSSLRR
jgi:hypothetical protein